MGRYAFGLVAILGLAGVSQGATTFRGDVDVCIRYVNVVIQGEDFDAYVHTGTDGEVTTFGTKRASFEFSRCMDALGRPMVNLAK